MAPLLSGLLLGASLRSPSVAGFARWAGESTLRQAQGRLCPYARVGGVKMIPAPIRSPKLNSGSNRREALASLRSLLRRPYCHAIGQENGQQNPVFDGLGVVRLYQPEVMNHAKDRG